MDRAAMLRAQRELRASWLELDDPPRRALQIRLPTDDQVVGWQDAVVKHRGGFEALPTLRKVAREVVIGWRGFTEADLLGPAIGAQSEQEFDREVFCEWIEYETQTLGKVFNHAVEAYAQHEKKKAEAEKN